MLQLPTIPTNFFKHEIPFRRHKPNPKAWKMKMVSGTIRNGLPSGIRKESPRGTRNKFPERNYSTCFLRYPQCVSRGLATRFRDALAKSLWHPPRLSRAAAMILDHLDNPQQVLEILARDLRGHQQQVFGEEEIAAVRLRNKFPKGTWSGSPGLATSSSWYICNGFFGYWQQVSE